MPGARSRGAPGVKIFGPSWSTYRDELGAEQTREVEPRRAVNLSHFVMKSLVLSCSLRGPDASL